jgi:hypothetical protein
MYRLKDNIEIDITELVCESADWILLVQVMVYSGYF